MLSLFPLVRLLFWTDYSDHASVHKAKTNGQDQETILSRGLFWPNALSTHDEWLYVADGAAKIFVIDFNGKLIDSSMVRSLA